MSLPNSPDGIGKYGNTSSGLYYNRVSYDRNPNKLGRSKFILKNLRINDLERNDLERNDLAYLDYDRSYDRNMVIVQATGG